MMFDDSTATRTAPSLPDIPDLSGLTEDRPEPWDNGYYVGTFVPSYTTTNRDGVIVTYASEDVPSQSGTSRNIFLRLQIKRKSDGRTLNTKDLVNYRVSDLTAATIAQVTAHKQAMKDAAAAGTSVPEWGALFRSFSALASIGTLQRIAGVRQFQRTPAGGLDITPLFGKTAYVRLVDDEKNARYKAVADISDTPPKKQPIL